MSIDRMQINICDVVYNDSTWLYESQPGSHNDALDAIEDLNAVFEDIVGLTKEGILLSSSDSSGTDNMQWEAQNPIYGGQSYLTHSNATSLRSSIITQLATIMNLQTYKDVYVRSYRNDMVSSTNYVPGASTKGEGLEIYISNIFYKNSSYIEPDVVDALLSDLNNAFDNIVGLEFAGVVVSTWKSELDGIFIGVDDVTYNGTKFLSFVSASNLRNEVLNAIATITDLDDSFAEVEIRVAKKDSIASS